MKTANNNHELNADQRIYLIKFSFASVNDKFLTTDLGKTIKEHDPGRGIDYIKEFNPEKNTFTRISKADILRFHSWNTESHLFLKSHYYFK